MTETPGLEDTVFMSVDGAFTQQYIQAAGTAAEGTYISSLTGAGTREHRAAVTGRNAGELIRKGDKWT